MRKTIEIFGKIDGITILLYLFLVFFGWINIYASMYNDDMTTSIFDLSTKYGKQLLFIGISIFIAFVILIIDWKFFDAFSVRANFESKVHLDIQKRKCSISIKTRKMLSHVLKKK